jgi:integrase
MRPVAFRGTKLLYFWPVSALMRNKMKADDNNRAGARSKRGSGRLYKRDGAGKEYPEDSKVHGTFWLQYSVGGKRIRERLLDEHGRPITTRYKAEAERARILAPLNAKDKADQLRFVHAKLAEAEALEEKAFDEASPPLPLSKVWDAYLRSSERPDSSEAMLSRYCGYWEQFVEWCRCQGDDEVTALRSVSPELAQRYAGVLAKKGVSPNTFNKHVRLLKLVFCVLKGPGRLTGNPFEKITTKKLKTEVRRELNIGELKAVLGSAEGELQTLFYIGTFTGLRLGDCCTLKWSEVDLNRGIIRRVPSKTKSSKGKPVTVGIPAPLFNQLALTPKNKRRGYVIPTYANLYTYTNAEGHPIRQSLITREIQQHFEAQGIQTHKDGTGYRLEQDPECVGKFVKVHTGKRAVVEVGFHSLRHTYVSLQAESGTPQAVVQAIVGHGNPAMTAHYTHIGEEAAKKAALVLDSGIIDAEFEVLQDPLPPWAMELIQQLDASNWEQVKAALLS